MGSRLPTCPFANPTQMAADNRKRLLDRAAADKMAVERYRFPFPACGHIAKTAMGYELVPVTWQPL